MKAIRLLLLNLICSFLLLEGMRYTLASECRTHLAVLNTAFLEHVEKPRKNLFFCLGAVLVVGMGFHVVSAFDVVVRHDSVTRFIHLLECFLDDGRSVRIQRWLKRS